jgi:hypothetical protein
MSRRWPILLVTVILAAGPLQAQDEDKDKEENTSLGDAIRKGKFSLNLRYRFEAVDQEGLDDNGYASTLRTSISYRMRDWHGLSVAFEVEDVHNLGLGDSHNNAGAGFRSNGVTDRPVIADPQITELNQVFGAWKYKDAFKFQGGRQGINLDNQRFVGTVGWRQNHQSYNSARFDLTSFANATITYAFLGKVHRINGGFKNMTSHLLDGEYRFKWGGKVRFYNYYLDYSESADAGSSRNSLGGAFTGSTEISKSVKLVYRLELAQQWDVGTNPNNVEVGYRRIDIGPHWGPYTFTFGYEQLQGRPDRDRCLTPLATLHAFNGWADKFLDTPQDGLNDLFVSARANFEDVNLLVFYHHFSSDTGSTKYGTELDALALFTLPWEQRIGLKMALYNADDHATDTSKYWIFTQWGF